VTANLRIGLASAARRGDGLIRRMPAQVRQKSRDGNKNTSKFQQNFKKIKAIEA
jgi:hypothetical protein